MRYFLTVCLCALALSTLGLAQQTSQWLFDCGPSATASTSVPMTWNNLSAVNMGPLVIVDSTGIPTFATLSFNPSNTFVSANSAGSQNVQAGSPLAALGWPISAIRDYMYGSNSKPLVEMIISGLDPTAIVDFQFVASRTGATDVRDTDYHVIGANSGIVTLDASLNTSQVATLNGMIPTANGTITIQMSASASNTNSSGFFYLNAMGMSVTTTGVLTPTLGFSKSTISTDAIPNASYQETVSVLCNDGTTPLASLSAVDTATQQAPTWLTHVGTVNVPQNVAFTVDTTNLSLGAHTAMITTQEVGYLPGTLYLTVNVVAPITGKNLLFYGNSYSIGNSGVPDLVGRIALEAGQAPPRIVAQLVGGQKLFYHLTNPAQAAAIEGTLPKGENWDVVTMQGFSLEATRKHGDPDAFVANATAILANVKARSPQAQAVMYQTWARGPGYSSYNSVYPGGPPQMHADIHANYRKAANNMNAIYGAGTARVAPVGDGVANEGFPLSWYTSDLSHPTQPLSVLAGLMIYSAIYGEAVSSIHPDLNGNSALAQRLNSLGITAQDWADLTKIADRLLALDSRFLAGSGTDLEILSGVNTPMDLEAKKVAHAGDLLNLAINSHLAQYSLAPVFLFGQVSAPGLLPSLNLQLPYVHIDQGAHYLASQALMPAYLADWSLLIPAGPQFDLRLQGFALQAGPDHPLLTATDAQLIEVR